jgi:hypothetical protein
MKHIVVKQLLFCFLVLVLALCISGCGEQIEGYTIDQDEVFHNDNPAAVAVILGKHANAMAIPEDAYKCMDSILDQTVYGGYLCAIIADSTPTKLELVDLDFYKEDAHNGDVLEKRIKSRKLEIVERLKSLPPADSMEVDLLEAIREAKNALSMPSVEAIQNKQIIIIDTGVSTTGYVDFTTMDVVGGKPTKESVIAVLKVHEGFGVLPDLTGISVSMIGTAEGMAEVAAPQVLTATDKRYIRELWTAIVTESGAENVSYYSAAGWDKPNIYTEDEESEFLYVTSVPFFHDSIIDLSKLQSLNSGDPDEMPDLPPPPVMAELKSEMIGFLPDSSKYYNDTTARQFITPYALDLLEYLKSYPEEKIWIVGTSATTHPGGEGSVGLSLQRAETVKDNLIALGVPEDNLITVGLGAVFPWHVNEFVQGVFHSELAQENRSVYLLDSSEDNQMFQKLKEAYEKGELVSEALERFAKYF